MLHSHFLYGRRTAVVERPVYAAASHKFPALHGNRTVAATFCLHFTSRRGYRKNIFWGSSLKNPQKKTKEKFLFIFLRTWCDRRTLAIRLRQ